MHPTTADLRQFRRLLGRALHEQRLQQRCCLARLARKTGISAARLDRFELGKDAIRLEDLFRIAAALDLRIAPLPFMHAAA